MAAEDLRNPFYYLLLIASFVFMGTALAYAVIPVVEQNAADMGQPPPPSLLRDTLRADGGTWLLVELGFMVLFGALSMGLDRLRSLRKEREEAMMAAKKNIDPAFPVQP